RSVPLERDDFSSNRHPALTSSWSMIFFRKPVPTFRDHALADSRSAEAGRTGEKALQSGLGEVGLLDGRAPSGTRAAHQPTQRQRLDRRGRHRRALARTAVKGTEAIYPAGAGNDRQSPHHGGRDVGSDRHMGWSDFRESQFLLQM